MLVHTMNEYEINESEYAFLTITTHHTAPNFDLHVPKLMTFPRGAPTQSTRQYNKSIFVNDDKCKPSASGALATQNFLNIDRYFDKDLSLRADPAGLLYDGTRFIVHFMDKNIQDVHISQAT